MKILKNPFLIFTLLILGSCSNDDSSEFSIQGRWQLMSAINHDGEVSVIDYSGDNIIYDFQKDGKLIVSGGGTNIFSETYDYEFKFDHVSPEPMEGESKEWFVIIDGARWKFTEDGNTKTLSMAYVDGPTYTFKRR